MLTTLSHLRTLDLAFSSFESRYFKVLALFTGLEDLNLSGVPSDTFRRLSTMTNLTRLNLSRSVMTAERDFAALSNLTSLRSLNLTDCRMPSLVFLTTCQNLQTLILTGCWNIDEASSLPCFYHISRLEHLSLQYILWSGNVCRFLTHITTLSYLDLRCPNVLTTSLAFLSCLPRLSALHYERVFQRSEFLSQPPLRGLLGLNLYGNSDLTDEDLACATA
jgi:hypothetical protein